MLHAAEAKSVETVLESLPDMEQWLDTRLKRITAHARLAQGDRVADVGAGAGGYTIAFKRSGYDVVGIEPWAPARETAREAAARVGVEVEMVDGTAEHMPLPDESVQLVHAMSVVEHVEDLAQTFQEAFRVLLPGGSFFFLTTNSRSPRQNEIRGFPLFGWYPGRVKDRIMVWARDHRPALVGHTKTPAFHWFNPRLVDCLAQETGFSSSLNRWEMKLEGELTPNKRFALRLLNARPQPDSLLMSSSAIRLGSALSEPVTEGKMRLRPTRRWLPAA